MACYNCGKGVLMGRTHTHHRGVAGGRWKKRAPKVARAFYPNLQIVDILLDKKEKRVKLCTKCLKRVKKDLRDGVRPFVTLVNMHTLEAKKPAVIKVKAAKKKKTVN